MGCTSAKQQSNNNNHSSQQQSSPQRQSRHTECNSPNMMPSTKRTTILSTKTAVSSRHSWNCNGQKDAANQQQEGIESAEIYLEVIRAIKQKKQEEEYNFNYDTSSKRSIASSEFDEFQGEEY